MMMAVTVSVCAAVDGRGYRGGCPWVAVVGGGVIAIAATALGERSAEETHAVGVSLTFICCRYSLPIQVASLFPRGDSQR